MNRSRGIVIFSIFAIFLVASVGANDLVLTIVYDNNPYRKGLETRWGFSCFVEGLDRTILFDVGGEGLLTLKNMERLKIDPQKVDIVMLSHIHYDHIGGLSCFLKRNSDVRVYIPKSFPPSIKREAQNAGAELVGVDHSTEICKNAYSTGELGSWIKEQSLIIKTSKGLVIITGCAHPGIVNIVKRAKKIAGADVYLIVGGFHLCWMNSRQVKEIIRGAQKEGVEKVAPCHCSGDLARQLFEKAYGKDFILTGAGKRIIITDAF